MGHAVSGLSWWSVDTWPLFALLHPFFVGFHLLPFPILEVHSWTGAHPIPVLGSVSAVHAAVQLWERLLKFLVLFSQLQFMPLSSPGHHLRILEHFATHFRSMTGYDWPVQKVCFRSLFNIRSLIISCALLFFSSLITSCDSSLSSSPTTWTPHLCVSPWGRPWCPAFLCHCRGPWWWTGVARLEEFDIYSPCLGFICALCIVCTSFQYGTLTQSNFLRLLVLGYHYL